jgi:hypothetical protein
VAPAVLPPVWLSDVAFRLAYNGAHGQLSSAHGADRRPVQKK